MIGCRSAVSLQVATDDLFFKDRHFSILAGVALGERGSKLSINLDDASLWPSQERLSVNHILGITLTFFVIAFGYGMYSTILESDLDAAHRSAKENHKIQLEDLNKKVHVGSSEDKATLTALDHEITELKAVLQVMQLPSRDALSFSEWLIQLSQRTPNGIALTSIEAQGKQYTLSGVTTSSSLLYSWVATLNASVLNNITKFEVFDVHQNI